MRKLRAFLGNRLVLDEFLDEFLGPDFALFAAEP
jgi:hypothetical protein